MRVGISTNGSRSLAYYYNLIDSGIELFSISLDVHKNYLNRKFTMVDNIFDTVVNNIRELSARRYTNVGVVFTDDNIGSYREILEFISGLGVHDIRIMTSTKYNKVITLDVPQKLLDQHPILKFRVDNFNSGLNMRGSELAQTSRCHLVRDDITILGGDMYSCAVYAREGGKPIGVFGKYNEELRYRWFGEHNSHQDPICKKFCMDFKCRFNDKADRCR
jgi:MoaA/NifB/PqqE/SkfB family radical SAM enzyme